MAAGVGRSEGVARVQVRDPTGDEYQRLTGFGMAMFVLEQVRIVAREVNELAADVEGLKAELARRDRAPRF